MKKKASDKIQHQFIVSTLKKLEIEENFLNLKGHFEKKLAVNIVFNSEDRKKFLLEINKSDRKPEFYSTVYCRP